MRRRTSEVAVGCASERNVTPRVESVASQVWTEPERESLSERRQAAFIMSLDIGELDDDEYESDYEADGLEEDSDDDGF